MKCPNCQFENRESAKFCDNCGHKLKTVCPNCASLNRAEAKFCDNCGFRLAQSEAKPAAAAPQSPLSKFIPKELARKLESARANRLMEGERRVVTILFCDVKGSTQAAERLDPEEWAEIMNGAFERMIRPVARYEGTVARLMGDAVLAFFGAPIAHEDDPQRAVLAGLGITTGMQDYRRQVQQTWDIDLNVRVGINTGLVVVGAVGSDLRMEYTAMGDAINVAARMEQTAEPGSVQIAEDTYRQVAYLFEFEDLGGVQVKGKAAPVQSYRVLGRKAAPGQQRGLAGLAAPLIGREQEQSTLEQALVRLDKGLGGIVHLVGEAGLGKSRLIQEVKSANNGRAAWFETFSLSYETELPYALFRRLVRRMISALPDESPAGVRAKLAAAVAEAPQTEQPSTLRVFESLFGLASASGEPPLEGETFKGLLYKVMADWWQQRAQAEPVVLVFDDLHWCDPASAALLQHLFPLTNQTGLLLVCAMRQEREAPGWHVMQAASADFPQRYTEIRLQSLNSSQSGALVDSLLHIADLPDELRRRIMEKSEGNPYFIEEVVRSLIEQGLVVRDENGDRWKASAQSSDFDIPGNLQTLLVARIDRLAEEARRTLQTASVVGRSFYYRILQRLVEPAAEDLDRQLLSLQRAQMIEEARRLPELEYLFQHALTQEAAYSTILLKQRRQFHRQVGEALETLFPDQLVELSPRLAFHFAQGRQAQKALAYYSMAGEAALRMFAVQEALSNNEQALKWAEAGGATHQQLIDLYRRRGRALELLLRHDEALETYQRLEELGEQLQDDSVRLAGISAQAVEYWFGHSEFIKGRQRSEEALALARQLGDRYTEARSLWSLLLSYTWDDNRKALDCGERGLEIAQALVSRPQPASEDLELLALILVDLSLVLAATGQVTRAREAAIEAQQLFEKLGNLPMASTAMQRLGIAYKMAGQFARSEAVTDQAMEIDRSIGNEGGIVGGALGMLDLYLETGDYAKFFKLLDEISPIVVREGRLPVAIFELYPIAVYEHLGAIDQVQMMIDRILEFSESENELFSSLYVGNAILAYIKAGQLETGKKLLEKIRPDFDIKSYLISWGPLLPQIRAELALANGALDEALAYVDDFLEGIRQTEILRYLPEKLLLKGRILQKANRPEEAYQALQEAHALATEQQARPSLWRICSLLAEMERERGNLTRAQLLEEQACSVIETLAENAGRDDLRASFLARPQVQALLGNSLKES